jgi:hypothetical protein
MKNVYLSAFYFFLIMSTAVCMEGQPYSQSQAVNLEDHFAAIIALKKISYAVRKRPYKKERNKYLFSGPQSFYGHATHQGIQYTICYPKDTIHDVYTVKPYQILHSHELFTPWAPYDCFLSTYLKSKKNFYHVSKQPL